jgi:hypothetical protein
MSPDLVHWTCNLKGQGWFIMRSFTRDFVTFSPAEIWLRDAGMDATVKFDGSRYHRISKNGPNNLLEHATAPSLDGPWTTVRNGIGAPLPAGEGPLAFQSNANPSQVRCCLVLLGCLQKRDGWLTAYSGSYLLTM